MGTMRDRPVRYSLSGTGADFRLECEYLVIRQYTNADIGDLSTYLSREDHMVKRVMGIEPTETAIRGYWGPMRKIDPVSDTSRWLSLVIEINDEQKVVGNIGFGIEEIDTSHVQGTIGWSLSIDYRGRGIATIAATILLDFLFRVRKLHRVSARTGRANEGSWRLMERLGMRREAHLHLSHTNLAGNWDDEFIYAVLRNEWAGRAVLT